MRGRIRFFNADTIGHEQEHQRTVGRVVATENARWEAGLPIEACGTSPEGAAAAFSRKLKDALSAADKRVDTNPEPTDTAGFPDCPTACERKRAGQQCSRCDDNNICAEATEFRCPRVAPSAARGRRARTASASRRPRARLAAWGSSAIRTALRSVLAGVGPQRTAPGVSSARSASAASPARAAASPNAGWTRSERSQLRLRLTASRIAFAACSPLPRIGNGAGAPPGPSWRG